MTLLPILLLAATTAGLSTTWHDAAPLPLARAAYAGGWLAGRYIVAGGSYWPDPETKRRAARVDAYNPVTDTWSSLPDLPRGLAECGGAVVGDSFYVSGGFDGEAGRPEVLRLRAGANEWETFTPLPQPLALQGTAVIGSKIYLVGGVERADTLVGLTNQMLVLDTAQPAAGWQQLAPLPGPGRFLPAITASEGKVYVFGGGSKQGDEVVNRRDAHVYDPGANQWRQLRDAPQAQRCASALAVDGHLLLLGGYTGDTETGFVSDVWDYDPSTDSYVQAGNLTHPVGVLTFVKAGDLLLGAGGEKLAKQRADWLMIGKLTRR